MDLGLAALEATLANVFASGRAISSEGIGLAYTPGNSPAWTVGLNGAAMNLGLVAGRNRANPEAVNASGLTVGTVRQNQTGTILPAYWTDGVPMLYTLPTPHPSRVGEVPF